MTTSTSNEAVPSHRHEHNSSEQRGVRKGRRLIDKPHLLGPHEEPATYWELFSDLLMVAAGSSLAEVLEEEPTIRGWLQFALLYIIIVNGWLLCTHHYTARFDDSSLAHSCVLFFYYLGMAGSIVNADFESYRGFSFSVIFQRIAFGVLIAPVAFFIPTARWFVYTLIGWICVSSLLFFLIILLVDSSEHSLLIPLWVAAATWEFLSEVGLVVILKGDRLIKTNIEHTKERMGVLVLVMLGETVITSTITYKEFASEESTNKSQYYTVLTLAFLLIFMFLLLFFNMQPAPKDHALRRSRSTGVTFCFSTNSWVCLC